jgi:hypothetical protein
VPMDIVPGAAVPLYGRVAIVVPETLRGRLVIVTPFIFPVANV